MSVDSNRTFAGVERLVLLRLVCASRALAPSTLRRQLGGYVGPRSTDAERRDLVDAAVERLRAAALVEARGLRLTESGRAAVRTILGQAELPRVRWSTMKSSWIVPLALGCAPSTVEARVLGNPDRLRGELLRREHHLTVGEGATLGQSIDALLWQALGVTTAERFTLGRVRLHLLSRLAGTGDMSATSIADMLAARAANSPRRDPESLRTALISRWVEGSTERLRSDGVIEGDVDRTDIDVSKPRSASSEVVTSDALLTFAREVQRVGRDPSVHRFGARKAYIHSLWTAWNDASLAPNYETFTRRLVEAHQCGFLRLARADLVGAMDAEQVARSEVTHLTATFHFVALEDPA